MLQCYLSVHVEYLCCCYPKFVDVFYFPICSQLLQSECRKRVQEEPFLLKVEDAPLYSRCLGQVSAELISYHYQRRHQHHAE